MGQPKEAKVREGTKKPKKTKKPGLSKLTGPGPGPVPYCPLRAFGCFGFLGSQSGLPREPERDLGFLYYTIHKKGSLREKGNFLNTLLKRDALREERDPH